MESWRKFLNEQPYDDDRGLRPTVAQMKAAAQNPPTALQRGFGDEMSIDAEKMEKFQDDLLDLELEYPDAFEAEQEQDVDRTFPAYKDSAGKERNFINPTKGGRVRGKFDQTRKKCVPPKGSDMEPKQIYHNAIDVYNTKGSPFLAVADGIVTNVLSESAYNKKVATLAQKLIGIAKTITDPKKSTVKETIEKLKQTKTWDDIRKIQTDHLYYGSVASYVRKNMWIMGTGGMSVTIMTSPDQRNRQWFIYGCHLDSVDVSVGQKVTAGQTLGTCGSTTIADSAPHLHLEVWLPRGSDVSDLHEPEKHTRQKIWRSCAERTGNSLAARAERIFPNLKGAKKKQGIYQKS